MLKFSHILFVLLVCQTVSSKGHLVAGWDFSSIDSLGDKVLKYTSEYQSEDQQSRKGFISYDKTPEVKFFFAANGSTATSEASKFRFDRKTSVLFGGTETGQQSVNFKTQNGKADISIHFEDTYAALIHADWLTSSTKGPVDILDISYSYDGGKSWKSYDKAGPGSGYVALSDTSKWTNSDSDFGGFIGMVSTQEDMTIDLRAISHTQPINAVRLEFRNLQKNERVGIDNILVVGHKSG